MPTSRNCTFKQQKGTLQKTGNGQHCWKKEKQQLKTEMTIQHQLYRWHFLRENGTSGVIINREADS